MVTSRVVGQSVRPTMMNAGADGWSRRRDVCRPIARRQTMKTPEEDGEFEVDTHSSITHKALHQKLMFVKFQKLNRSQDKKTGK